MIAFTNSMGCASSSIPKSFIYLHGMTLDYEETLMRQGFNFINPNSTRSCGCGSSFSSSSVSLLEFLMLKVHRFCSTGCMLVVFRRAQ